MRLLLIVVALFAGAAPSRAVETVRGVVVATPEIACGATCGAYAIEPDPGYSFTLLEGNFDVYLGKHVQVAGFLDNCAGCLSLLPSEAVIVLPPTTGVGAAAPPLPALPHLSPNYPNPFNPSTAIAYELAAESQVRLSVLNVLGEEVALLDEGERPPGAHRVDWLPGDRPAGAYFCRLEVAQGSVRRILTRAMLYLR